jgi:electron transfer flavoprotein alpha subunit
MKTLVLVEHESGQLKDATLATVTAASRLGDVHLLVAGSGVSDIAQQAAKIAGVGKVHVADDPAYEHQLAENVAPLAASLMETHDAFLAPATTTGKNVAPRVAALLDVMQISDIIAIEDENTFVRPIYAGNAIATVRSSDTKNVITVRGTAFDKAAREGGSAEVEQVSSPGDQGLSSFVKMEAAHSDRPELTSAASSSRAGARSEATSSSTRFSTRSPTSSAPPSGPAGPRSMPVLLPTTIRSARPARSSPRSFISRSVFPAPSSTSPE